MQSFKSDARAWLGKQRADRKHNGKNPDRGERPPTKCFAQRGCRTFGFFCDQVKRSASISRASGVPFAGRVRDYQRAMCTFRAVDRVAAELTAALEVAA